MNHDEDELRARVADQRISAIAVDTSIFDKFGNGFEHGSLAKLSQFRHTHVQVLISDVVAREVRGHLVRNAITASAALKTALKGMSAPWNLSQEARNALSGQATSGESAEQMADRRLATFKAATGMQEIDSGDRMDTRRLLKDYFAAAAPFGATVAKKNEFPDAIALHALEHWANEKDTEILVVSSDKDWMQFCSNSQHLVCVTDLAVALDHFHQDTSVTRARIAGRIGSGELNVDLQLQEAIKWAADSIDFLADGHASYRFEADIWNVEVQEQTLVQSEDGVPDLKVIDSDDDQIVLEAEAVVSMAVTANFSFSTTDPIDKDEMRLGTCSVSQEVVMSAKVLLTFALSPNAEAELNHVEANFEGGTVWVEYGEVEPDWGDNSY